jgi:hypothetical protein
MVRDASWGVITLLKSLPHSDYATTLALIAATAAVVLAFLEGALRVYRHWLAACADRHVTKRRVSGEACVSRRLPEWTAEHPERPLGTASGQPNELW